MAHRVFILLIKKSKDQIKAQDGCDKGEKA
jgi:hypothetical protein